MKPVTITLDWLDAISIRESLDARREAYERTADWYEHEGNLGDTDDFQIIEEVRDAAEAWGIASTIARIIRIIDTALDAEKGVTA